MAASTTATDQTYIGAAGASSSVGADPDVDPCWALVRLAVEEDDPSGLIATASVALERPMGAVTLTGEELGHAPDDVEGRRALAVAAAAARARLIAPPAWSVRPITHAGMCLGFLAVGAGRDADRDGSRLLELVTTLLGEQLRRGGLLREQTAAFVRRVVTEPEITPERARHDAAALGLKLHVASAYRPALVTWHGAPVSPETVERLGREASRVVDGGLTTMLHGRLVLLHPGAAAGRPEAWFARVVARARAIAPSSGAQALTADADIPLGQLSGCVEQLEDLCALGAPDAHARPVVSVARYALHRLLRESVSTPEGQRFVEKWLGPVMAWDRDHGTGLLQVLEAALDHPRQDQAAGRCFMHRNTFRQRLRQATRLLGQDLDDPDVRLAIHVALKLRPLLRTRAPTAAAAREQPRRRSRGAGCG